MLQQRSGLQQNLPIDTTSSLVLTCAWSDSIGLPPKSSKESAN
jgi:hypothetical protein